MSRKKEKSKSPCYAWTRGSDKSFTAAIITCVLEDHRKPARGRGKESQGQEGYGDEDCDERGNEEVMTTVKGHGRFHNRKLRKVEKHALSRVHPYLPMDNKHPLL